MIRKLRVPIGIALILVIASIGFANATPRILQIVRMSYATSEEQILMLPPTTTWTTLPGNQYPVAHLTLDGNPDTWYYLTVDSFTTTKEYEIPTGYVYLFFLTPPENPAFWDWWTASPRNVNEAYALANPDSWQAIMWDIITGEKHMFGFVPNWPVGPRVGLPKLIDSLQYYLCMATGGAAGSPMADLMLQGDYPPGTYEFTCRAVFSGTIDPPWSNYLDGVTMTMKIR
jgi:hypothetical protein